MANLDSPLGFNPLRGPHGNTIPAEPYNLIASDNCAPGTILYLNDAGTVTPYSGTTTGNTALLGAAMGYVATAATDRQVLISVDPAQEYAVQVDDDALTALTDMQGANFLGTNLATVNTTLIQSRGEIDGSSATSVNNTTTFAVFKAVRFSRVMDEDVLVSFPTIIVKINAQNHHFGAPGTGLL